MEKESVISPGHSSVMLDVMRNHYSPQDALDQGIPTLIFWVSSLSGAS